MRLLSPHRTVSPRWECGGKPQTYGIQGPALSQRRANSTIALLPSCGRHRRHSRLPSCSSSRCSGHQDSAQCSHLATQAGFPQTQRPESMGVAADSRGVYVHSGMCVRSFAAHRDPVSRLSSLPRRPSLPHVSPQAPRTKFPGRTRSQFSAPSFPNSKPSSPVPQVAITSSFSAL